MRMQPGRKPAWRALVPMASIALVICAPRELSAATAYPGYTFFASGATGYLVNATGTVVHTWKASGSAQTCAYLLADGSALFPIQNSSCTSPTHNGAYPSGRFQKISWDGAVLWDYKFCDSTARAGYDVEPMPNGNILVPADSSSASKIFEIQPSGTNGGTVVWTCQLPTNLTASTTYINSVKYNPELDRIVVDLQDPQRKLAVIDHSSSTGTVLFTYLVGASGRVHAANWVTQFFPGTSTPLPDADITAMRVNNLLVVYNGGDQAVEVNVASNAAVKTFSYAFDDHEGSVQRLPNGNTLVTPGNSKTITELDASGTTVATLTAPGNIYRAYRYGLAFAGVSRLVTNTASTVVFTNAAACSPLSVNYYPNSGSLQTATQVFAHVGYNGWTQVLPTQLMSRVTTNQWRLSVTPPQGTSQLNVAFHNGAGTWDRNGGTHWNLALNVCTSTPVQTLIAITNAPASNDVTAADSTFTLQGYATGMAGDLSWSNALNVATGTTPAASAWSIADIPLAIGTNQITVSGTNGWLTVTNAADSGGNFVYEDGWTTNDSGGFGFGRWQATLGATNTARNGFFMGTGAVVNIGVPAWGLYANSNNLAEVRRSLTNGLSIGQTFAVRVDHGFVNSGGGIGVALQNSAGNTLWQLYFNGGDTNYTMTGSPTDLAWTSNGVDVAVTLTASASYTATLTPIGESPHTYSGNLDVSTNMNISTFRAWNSTAGTGADHDFYFTDLKVTAPAAQSAAAAAASLIVVRPPEAVTNVDVRLSIDCHETESGVLWIGASDVPQAVTASLLRATSLTVGDWQTVGTFVVTSPTNWPISYEGSNAFYRLKSE